MTDAQRRIVDAAVEAFAERGYHGTPTSVIAERAGVAEGTIFRYYRTKKDLLVGAVAPALVRVIAPVVARNLDRVFAAPHPSVEALLRAIIADRLEFVREHPAVLRVLAQEIPFHPELRDALKDAVFDRLFPLGLAAVRRFQHTGQIDAALPPEAVARIVASVFVGYVLTRVFLAPDRAWDDDREVDAMVRVLARGLSPGGPPA